MKKIRTILRKLKMFYLRKKYGLKHVHLTFYLGGFNHTISSDLVAGPYTSISCNSIIYPKVKIGSYGLFAQNISIVGGDHRFDVPGVPIVFTGRGEVKPTIIGDDVWVGKNVIINCGVIIGDGSIIAAGSVVTKDVEPFSVYGGVPARKVKDRFKSKEEVEKHKKMLSEAPSCFGYGAFGEQRKI